MGQVTAKMRNTTVGFSWWCPGCEKGHPLPYKRGGWKFDGNLESPTFAPSFKHDLGGGKVCHYIVTAGQVAFCSDCTHSLAGRTIPMPDLPPHLRDDYAAPYGEWCRDPNACKGKGYCPLDPTCGD